MGAAFWLLSFGVGNYFIAITAMFIWLHWQRKQNARRYRSDYRPGVTILKPLSGEDEELAENIASFLSLSYEPLQIIFGSRSPDDPGMLVARAVAARFPKHDVLFIDHNNSDAVSPKIGNLETMLPHAKHELILLSDSNVRIAPNDLTQLVQPMQDPQVGLVYQPVVGVGEQNVSAACENLRLSEFAGVITITLRALLGQDAVMGKGMLCRRAALDATDGLRQVRDMAGDDFMLGVAIKRGGWRLVLSTVASHVIHVHWPMSSFVKRHTRHAALRWRMNVISPFAELVITPLFMGSCALAIGGLSWWPAFIGLLLTKIGLESIATRHLRGTPIPWRYKAAIPLKDAIMLYIWVVSLFNNKVHWRNRTYRMGWKSILRQVPSANGMAEPHGRRSEHASAEHATADKS